MYLKPSNIFYSQNHISSTFGAFTKHRDVKIGSTLDDLYYGRIQIEDIPTIRVVEKNGKWYTVDNRRLWIFHHLEGAGKCSEIKVNERYRLDHFNTRNGGTFVWISRGEDPGGECHRKIIPVTPRRIENENQGSDASDVNNRTAGAELCGEDKSEDPGPDYILNQSLVTNTGTSAQPVNAFCGSTNADIGEGENKGLESKPGRITDVGEDDVSLKPAGTIDVEESEDKGFGSKMDAITKVRAGENECFKSKPGAITMGDVRASVFKSAADTDAGRPNLTRRSGGEDDDIEGPKRFKVENAS